METSRSVRVFVSIGKGLPSNLVWLVLNNLQLPHVTPLVYQRVPKPVGLTVNNVFIEARNDLRSAELVVLVLASDGSGRISDDWSLGFIREVKARGARVSMYLVPSTDKEIEWVSLSDVPSEVGSVTSLENADDVVSAITAEIAALARIQPN